MLPKLFTAALESNIPTTDLVGKQWLEDKWRISLSSSFGDDILLNANTPHELHQMLQE